MQYLLSAPAGGLNWGYKPLNLGLVYEDIT